MKVLDRLIEAIRSTATCNREIKVAPACILWPDKERQWENVLPRLLQEIPELICLRDYDPLRRTGPAIWIRCAVAKAVKTLSLPDNRPPIVYLPGIARQELRQVESCNKSLQPLIYMQYFGTYWSQISSKDWTVRAFVKSPQGGLGLDVSMDRDTQQSLQRAMNSFLDEDLSLLQGKRLDKDYFNNLLTGGDPDRDVLQWLNQPDIFKQNHDDNSWRAFVDICKSRLLFDPQTDGTLTGYDLLARHEGPWGTVWLRFCEAPQRYPSIPAFIRNCVPPKSSIRWLTTRADAFNEGWPQWNEEQENDLRKEFLSFSALPEHEARNKILDLEQDHGSRRTLVWAELHEAPLACALLHLKYVAELTKQSPDVGVLSDFTAQYEDAGWKVDDQVLRALSYIDSTQDLEAVQTVLRSIYLPWIESSARYLQALCEQAGYPGGTCHTYQVPGFLPGDCMLFVDGLRYDLAKRLQHILLDRGCSVQASSVWTALPSVTASGKPRVTPIANCFWGEASNADFAPSVRKTGQILNQTVLNRQLEGNGWTVLESAECSNGQGKAWCEMGNIDHEGHSRGWKLAKQIDVLMQEIADRAEELIDAGWKRIFVVTDHGWLLLPNGLPKSDLPSVLTENKWGRCATLKEGAICSERCFPWFWNPDLSVALADGVSCYRQNTEYAHGGLSFQECLTLQLVVSKHQTRVTSPVHFTDIVWQGLRCKVAVDGAFTGLVLDIRTKAGDADSSIVLGTKALKSNGVASVVVEDETLEGCSAFLVLLDESGTPVAQEQTTVGGIKE